MSELPIVGAQLSVLDLDRHRDWLFEKDRDLELPEFCMADILASPDACIDMARSRLDGWQGRLGIHGPFSGFELDVKDKEIRAVVQKRLDQALDVCGRLGAQQMVIHSPFDHWDHHNLDNSTRSRTTRVSACLDTLKPALARAEDMGVTMVLENIQDCDPEVRAAVVRAADCPALRLSVDVGHAHWAHVICGAPPADRYIQAAGEALGHVHLQDSDGYADRHWPLGRGNIQWFAMFEALKGIKSEPHLIVEINDFSQVAESVAHLERLGLAQ
ncbi:Sugar phosphate isomerase/epimerase [Salinihabitans flavidus]|uniref:Sugar phosphate isomerase/epimerase n=1 Tax=Salinihabitans flavidus TaxID=569882 RepID=A0A1H8NUZ8_9RHOB|nr:sugar phosphate isomerase/epimerase family protein [Salinihabitans flavidus]SEO33456.1 Sugar phosphate isomerase/epimerase [Salinihabitans flavidus]